MVGISIVYFHEKTMINIIIVTHENNKYYPQVFIDEYLYKI